MRKLQLQGHNHSCIDQQDGMFFFNWVPRLFVRAIPMGAVEDVGGINLNGLYAKDKKISTRAYSFNGYRLNYYVSPNYRWQIPYAEI